ncbi:MAG: GTPase ObgE [Elusimicrobiota bacterium]
MYIVIMFIDQAKIFIRAGKGGNGCFSFRREKFVPLGGPDGGNGGKGGDIYLEAGQKMRTLQDFHFHPHYRADNGENGRTSDKYGKGGEDLTLRLPLGTMVYKNGELLADLVEPGEKILIARGGRGGRGNAAFKTARNTAPRFAEKGEPGEELTLQLELKLLADAGIVGYPNAGKSTLLSRVSAAHPKIADYPFTTLSPNLGVVTYQDKNFVLADIPGLIEGAHEGKGLGDEFLRHIERTRLLIHLIDVFGFQGKDAYVSYLAVNRELKAHSKNLGKKKQIIVLNKIDAADAEQLKQFKQRMKKRKFFLISGVSGEGIQKLLQEIVRQLEKIPFPDKREIAVKYVAQPSFRISREDNVFVVTGHKIEDLVAMTNFEQPEGLARLQNIFKKIGLDEALAKAGAENGDIVRVGGQELAFQD